jgi:hypothetical protein
VIIVDDSSTFLSIKTFILLADTPGISLNPTLVVFSPLTSKAAAIMLFPSASIPGFSGVLQPINTSSSSTTSL